MKNTLCWTILFSVTYCVSCQSLLLDKVGCGTTKSCWSSPANCKSSRECGYLLKYSVSGQNVEFELSSNKYKWIAVGFNPKVASMAGGESLACETHGSNVVLRHYDMPEKRSPDPSPNSNATLISRTVKATDNVLYCKIQRKVDLTILKRTNLNNLVYLLYAAADMKSPDKIGYHGNGISGTSRLLNVSTIMDNTDRSKAVKRIDTSGCGKTLACLRTPSSCNDNRDCDFLLTFKKNGANVDFSLSGKTEGWVSVGFNPKPKMGGTDAVICQPKDNGNVELSVASLEYSSPNLKMANVTKYLDGKFEGGIVYCKFSRPIQVTSQASARMSLDVSSYVIYGTGPGSTKVHKHKDNDRGCSEKKVDFESTLIYKLGECGPDGLEKVHGSFMIFAWMYLVVVSIFVARYSRSLWKGWKIFGKDAWFQLHRLLMGLAVLLTAIAIIIIFVDKEGWSESAGDHAIFGIIVLVLAIIQPTIAFFRPHPHEPRRPLFNWFHRIIAVIVVIFAVVTTFMGTEHIEDSGGETASKLIIALIVIAVITALILEFLAFRLRKRTPDINVNSGEMAEEVPKAAELFLEIKVQRVMLVVFTILVSILILVMIVFVAGGGSDDDDDDDDDDHHH